MPDCEARVTPVCPAGVVVSGNESVVLHYRAGKHLQNNMDVSFIVAQATQERGGLGQRVRMSHFSIAK